MVDDPPAPSEPPDFVRESPDEWVRLTSGEWLRGEVTVLSRETLEFDSEELDELNLDWDDVAELHTKKAFTVLLENRSTATGALHVQDGLVRVATEEGELVFRRGDVQRIVTGSPRESDLWSGKVKLGFTARRGNTDQTDTSIAVEARRRTADTRLDLSLDALQSEQGGTEVANNQRFQGQVDVFLTSRLFLTPIGLELYSDRFQNIDLRATPFTGLGYVFVDHSQVEWSGSAGLGYRWTRYDSVAPGEDREDREGVALLGTNVTSDLTEKIELDANYQVQISFDSLDKTQQNAGLELSYDVWGDLDFELGFSWTRVGDPQPDSSGNTPEPDDFRLDVGLSWSF